MQSSKLIKEKSTDLNEDDFEIGWSDTDENIILESVTTDIESINTQFTKLPQTMAYVNEPAIKYSQAPSGEPKKMKMKT